MPLKLMGWPKWDDANTTTTVLRIDDNGATLDGEPISRELAVEILGEPMAADAVRRTEAIAPGAYIRIRK